MTQIGSLVNGLTVDPSRFADAVKRAGALTRIVVRSCQRCGQDHEMSFRPLSNPADEFTHWGLCPTLAEPVVLAMRQRDVATDQGCDGQVRQNRGCDRTRRQG